MVTRTHTIQNSFTAGELSPLLRGRTDIAKYSNSVRELLNFIVSPYGSITKRPGFKFISEVKDSTVKTTILPFEFSNSEAYIIEFSGLDLRFYRNGGLIVQSRGIDDPFIDIDEWTDISSGTGSVELFGSNIKFKTTGAGNEGRVVLKELANYGTGTYTFSFTQGVSGNITFKVGTTSNGTEIANGVIGGVGAKSFNFTPPTNDSVFITLESTIDNMTVSIPSITNEVYEIPNNFDNGGLFGLNVDEVTFTQSSDVMYMFHKDFNPQKLIRYANDRWSMEDVVFDEMPYLDSQTTFTDSQLIFHPTTTITPSGTSGSITLTASSAIFVNNDVGTAVRYRAGPDTEGEVTYTGSGSQVNFDIPFFPQTSADIEVFLIPSTGVRTTQTDPTHYSVSNGQVVMVTTPTTSDKILIRPINSGSGEWGYMTITAVTNSTSATVTVNSDPLGGTLASLDWKLGAWGATTGYPRTGSFHEQRLFVGGSKAQAQHVWGSTIGFFEDFSPDTVLNKGDIADDTAVSFEIASTKAQTILWLSSQTSLLIGTSNGVHSLAGGTQSGITATSVKRRKETNVSCDPSLQVETSNQTIFIQRLNRAVNSISYRFEVDGYQTTNLSLLSEHIGSEDNGGFTKLAYQESPDTIIWGVLGNGKLVSCTFLPSQEVTGWAQHTIGGSTVSVEGIATIPGLFQDDVYIVVDRVINGGLKKYIEILTPTFNKTLGGNQVLAKRDQFFVDSGLVYSDAATTTISGLAHLEGETVTILVDGATHPTKVVSGGSITLDVSSGEVTVGLGYEATMETNVIESGAQYGTGQSTISRIIDVGLRIHQTIGLKVGYNSSLTDIIPFRSPSSNMNEGPDLFTGDKLLQFPHGQELGYKVYLKSDQPLACTILSLVFKAIISDR